MEMSKYMEQSESYVLHTYNRFPIVLEKGKGVYLYDTDGKEYLDFAAGIAVFALGYGNEAYNQALKDQPQRSLLRLRAWIRCSLRIVEQRPLKAQSRWLGSMPI